MLAEPMKSLASRILLLALAGCGYQPAHEARSSERLAVVSGGSAVARPEALQAALAGVREELSASGALRGGEGYPRVVVEILRVDEASSGIQVLGGSPLARGSSVGVLGRAWLEPSAGAPTARDTGDMRRVARYASSSDAAVEAQRHAQAVRAASRELGRALGRRVLGEPEPAQEGL
jgi:hypothetical protein